MEIDFDNFIDSLDTFLEEHVVHCLNNFDVNFSSMCLVFKKYKEAGFFKMYIPKTHGGLNLSHKQKVKIQVLLGEKSGALAFLQAQANVGCLLISESSQKIFVTDLFNQVNEKKSPSVILFIKLNRTIRNLS